MGVLRCDRCDHKIYKLKMIRILFFIIVIAGAFFNVRYIPASVTLLYFQASPEDDAVFVDWETATEIDSAGFYLSRSTTQDSNYERIGSFIQAKGDSVVGAYYEYRDSDVENGVTYYYILESWDFDNTVNYSDPVSATPGSTVQTATATVTLTLTQTLTPTPSPSPTSTSEITSAPDKTNTLEPTQTNTPAPNPTSTPNPTNTPTSPVIDTPTPLPTATSYEVLTVVPSATLYPLPMIIIVYPTPEWSITPTSSPTPTLTQEPQEDFLKTGFRALGLIGLVCVVGIIWVMLAIWIYLLLRQFNA